MKKIIIFIVLFILSKITFAQSDEVYNQQGVSISYQISFLNQTGQQKYKNILKNYTLKIIVRNGSGKIVNLGVGPSFSIKDYFYKEKDYIYEEFRYELKEKTASVSLSISDWELKPNSTAYASVNFSIPDGYNVPTPSFSFLGFRFVEVYSPQAPSEPEKPKQNSSSNQPVSFSEWRKVNSARCDLGIEYCSKREERYQLNYQLWFYYRVRNTSNKNISFTFNLTRNGKVEFSQPHVLSPGGQEEYMHKMSGNYIDGISVTKAINTVTNKDVCDDAGSSQSDNSNPTTSSSQSSIQELLNRWNELCQKADNSQNPAVISARSSACLTTDKTYDDNDANKRMIKANIKVLENAFSTDSDYQNKQSAAQKAVEEKIETERRAAEEQAAAVRKAAEEKAAQYSQYMNNGETALNNEEYDNAISNFSNAQNYASSDNERQAAANAVAKAQKAKEDAARKVRIDKQKETDKTEDVAYGTATTAVVGIMAMLSDKYAYKPGYFKIQAGLGIENLPMVINIDKNKESKTSVSLHPTFNLGFKFGFLNNKGISLHFNPSLQYGLNALSEGVSGTHLTYGALGTLFLSPKADSKLKAFAEGGYIKRVGDYTFDLDAVAGGTSATDRVEKSEYNYSTIRYGGGLMLHFINKSMLKETFVKPGIFLDKMSFAKTGDKPSMIFNLQANINSFIILDVSYSQNYAIGGTTIYPSTVKGENQNFWSFKIIRQGSF